MWRSVIPTTDDDFLPLSGIQHFVYCPRQCALIHVEGVFRENHATVDGRQLHEPMDKVGYRAREEVEVQRAVWLRSERLGLVGRADRVEVTRSAGRVVGLLPVEAKRSRRRSLFADSVQLCAQAMALEEMMGIGVPRGDLYYIRSRRRLTIDLTPELRRRTLDAARGYHALAAASAIPPAVLDGRCRLCSLRAMCAPEVTGRTGALAGHLAGLVAREFSHGH